MCPGVGFGPAPGSYRAALCSNDLDVLKMIFNFVLAPPPSPGGSRGRVRTAIFSKDIVVFGPIPAGILGFLIFVFGFNTARMMVAFDGQL
jgi:hypothetical protein